MSSQISFCSPLMGICGLFCLFSSVVIAAPMGPIPESSPSAVVVPPPVDLTGCSQNLSDQITTAGGIQYCRQRKASHYKSSYWVQASPPASAFQSITKSQHTTGAAFTISAFYNNGFPAPVPQGSQYRHTSWQPGSNMATVLDYLNGSLIGRSNTPMALPFSSNPLQFRGAAVSADSLSTFGMYNYEDLYFVFLGTQRKCVGFQRRYSSPVIIREGGGIGRIDSATALLGWSVSTLPELRCVDPSSYQHFSAADIIRNPVAGEHGFYWNVDVVDVSENCC